MASNSLIYTAPEIMLYNRYNRWGRRSLWRTLFERMAGTGSVPEELAIDATYINIRRSVGRK